MKEFELKYGLNPNQKPARIYMADGSDLPIEVLSGRPGYVNFLDALNSWQLVSELAEATGLPAAASFKHVSPTSAALGLPMSERLKRACFVEKVKGLDASPIALAYARARGTDRLSSFGDWAALSEPCDETTARLLKRETSDGVIAPGYSEAALQILREKKEGAYNIVKIDASYRPKAQERRDMFVVCFEERRNDEKIDEAQLSNIVTAKKEFPEEAKRDLLVALITLKYTQSNSVCCAFDGQAIGVGAGQQSRIHCTRLAGAKADNWFLRQADKVLDLPFRPELKRAVRDNVVDAYLNGNEENVLEDGVWEKYFTEKPEPFTEEEKRAWLHQQTGVSLASDAFFPFSDNIERAARSGVRYVAEPGGSIRDGDIIALADRYGMVMAFTGLRLFHH